MTHKPRDFDGSHWDTGRLRRVREAGWFRQHEPELIRDAIRRRTATSDAAVDDRHRTGHYRCPKCGSDKTSLRTLAGVTVGECSACGWISIDRRDIDRLVAELGGPGQARAAPVRSTGDSPRTDSTE